MNIVTNNFYKSNNTIMKKIQRMLRIILAVILFLALQFEVHSQFTSVPLRLVTSSGDPLTGKSGVIEFSKYPHNYPADLISGITVSEIGTAGNYIAKGFTDFRFVKLWLEGVEQLWFDSVLTGNIFTYLSSNYVTLGTNQTISGQKTTTGNWLGTTTGDWLFTGSTSHTFNRPYIFSGSPWLSDYSLIGIHSLLPRVAADSFYLKREFVYYDAADNKLYFNTPGVLGSFKLAKRGNGQLFEFNTSQFNWSTSTGLNLNTNILNQDSIASKIYSSLKDSTWIVLGEPVSKYRSLTLKKLFWSNPLTFPDWKWYYKSVDETGTINARDSFMVLNDAGHSAKVNPDEEIFADASWNAVDTITLPVKGTYMITYNAELIFPYQNVEGIAARDSVEFRMIREFDGFDNTPYTNLSVWRDWVSQMNYTPESSPISKSFSLFSQFAGGKWILQVRGRINSALIIAAVTRPQITYVLVR